MKLTPLDIKKQRFSLKFRGYDPTEVEAFLEMVSEEYESLLNERNQIHDELNKLKVQLRDYQQVEKTLQETLMNAQENVAQAREQSKREAQLILREAEVKAEKILEEAKEKLERMRNELTILRAQKESFSKRLRHLLESQVELIKVLEMDETEFLKSIGSLAPESGGNPQKPQV